MVQRNKNQGVLSETKLDVRHYEKDEYGKVIKRKYTIRGPSARVDYLLKLVSLAGLKIEGYSRKEVEGSVGDIMEIESKSSV